MQRKKTNSETAESIKAQLDQQNTQVDSLKRNLIGLESKISEAKTKKNMLKARAQSAKANEQLQNTLGNLSTGGSMAAFDRMEEKVLQMEARSQAAAELGSSGLEEQFSMLESSGGVDDELAAMKAQLSGGSPDQGQLPGSGESTGKKTSTDDELEKLRAELDGM